MKFTFKNLLFLAATPLFLVGCGNNGGGNTPAVVDPYDKVNTAINKIYREFVMSVTTTMSNITLTSTYEFVLSGQTYSVTATVESLAEITFDNPEVQKVTNISENTVSVEAVSFQKFVVNTTRYKNISYNKNGTFAGEISDPSGWLGTNKTVTAVNVGIVFGASLESIDYQYSVDSAVNVISYSNFVA